MVELGQAVNSVAVQLDAGDESDCLPIVGVAPVRLVTTVRVHLSPW